MTTETTGAHPTPRSPSRTAIGIAIMRAIGAKHPEAAYRNPDYLAAKLIGPRERALLPDDYPTDALDLDYEGALARIPDPSFVTTVFASTRFFDATLEDALRGGARQMVLLGAGLDTRGSRFAERQGGVRFFEVDSPSTQAYKRQRVQEVLGPTPEHVRYVPVDLAVDDLLTALHAHGYAEAGRTHFIWQGVVMYLPEDAVRETLRFVRDHAAAGSTLAFSYPLRTHPLINNPDSRPARMGEPWIFGFPGESAAAYVEQVGLLVVDDVSGEELVARYARRPDGTWALPAIGATSTGTGIRYCVARVP